jgi:hypothetical protein
MFDYSSGEIHSFEIRTFSGEFGELYKSEFPTVSTNPTVAKIMVAYMPSARFTCIPAMEMKGVWVSQSQTPNCSTTIFIGYPAAGLVVSLESSGASPSG